MEFQSTIWPVYLIRQNGPNITFCMDHFLVGNYTVVCASAFSAFFLRTFLALHKNFITLVEWRLLLHV